MKACEPRRPTLADLMVLVVGFALAVTPGRGAWGAPMWGGGNSPTPLWFTGLWYLSTWIFLAGTALGFVALARRWRYGGMFYPGELVAVVGSLGLLHYAIQVLCGMYSTPRADGFLFSPAFTLLVHGAFLGLAFEAVVAGRRRWPAWLTWLCLAVVWSGLGTWIATAATQLSWASGFRGGVGTVSDFLVDPVTSVTRLLGLVFLWIVPLAAEIVRKLVSHVPFVAALRLARRPERRSAPWTDAAGLGVCLLAWAMGTLSMFVSIIGNPWPSPGSSVIPRAALLLVLEVLAWGLSYALVRRYGPAVWRWMAPQHHGTQCPAAEEAISPSTWIEDTGGQATSGTQVLP